MSPHGVTEMVAGGADTALRRSVAVPEIAQSRYPIVGDVAKNDEPSPPALLSASPSCSADPEQLMLLQLVASRRPLK